MWVSVPFGGSFYWHEHPFSAQQQPLLRLYESDDLGISKLQMLGKGESRESLEQVEHLDRRKGARCRGLVGLPVQGRCWAPEIDSE